jgi:hypothetical protein
MRIKPTCTNNPQLRTPHTSLPTLATHITLTHTTHTHTLTHTHTHTQEFKYLASQAGQEIRNTFTQSTKVWCKYLLYSV